MAEGHEQEGIRRFITGKQIYFLDVPGSASAAALSVVSFEAIERVGEPYRVTIRLTHPGKLDRADYLGRDAAFMVAPEDVDGRKFAGWITGLTELKTTRDCTSYEIVLESHLARLAQVHTSRIYQHLTAPQIIDQVLQRHGLRAHQRNFRLRRKYPQLAFRFQYQMDDLAWVQLLMRQEGIYSYYTQGEHGDVLNLCDDIDHYIYQPPLDVPYREPSGLDAGTQAVTSLVTRTGTVPQLVSVADYNPDSAWERFADEANVASGDTTTYGKSYVWGTHHADMPGAKWAAQLRHEAAIAWQVVYEGESTVLALMPGRILDIDRAVADAPRGQLVVEVTHRGARDLSYSNTYRAIPAERRLRLPLDERHWPKVTGTLSARVTSPDRYRYAYLTQQGYYTVRFDIDFEEWPKGGESVPLRLAKPFAGALQTGFHFPLLDGTEVAVAFHDGDPNRPYIAHAMHNSQATDHINSQDRWLSRNVIRTQSDNKLQIEDWQGQEHFKLSTPHSGKSQLTLGHIVDGARKERGAGAELRTSAHLVNRGGAGVMVTAYDQPGANGKQLAMDEIVAQMKDLLTMAEALARSADASKATPADTDAQRAINDALNSLKKPGVLIGAPGAVGVLAGDGIELGSDGSIIATAKKSAHFSVLKRFTVAARDVVSLFTQAGMSLIAAAGAVVVQAQRGRMQLASQDDMSVESVNGVVHVKAAKEIILNVNGSYVKINGGGVEIGSRGGVLYRTAGVKGSGPAQMDLGGAAFAPQFVPYTTGCEVWRTSPKFAEQPTTATDLDLSTALANPGSVPVAPVVKKSTSPKPPTLQPQASPEIASDSPDSSNADHDSVNEPRLPAAADASEPVKLAKPVYCDWTMSSFASECEDKTETKAYKALDSFKAPWPDLNGNQIISGGQLSTAFELAYDSHEKQVTATIRVKVIPVDLVQADASGHAWIGADGKKQSLAYDHDSHVDYLRYNVGTAFNGMVVEYRDALGPRFDLETKKKQVEHVLNGHKSTLILDGCSKGASCGWRVKVVFRVEFQLALRDRTADGKSAHKSIYLFPKAIRADSSSWGEINLEMQSNGTYREPSFDKNVVAHECGHLFNFPDEYWEYGGWVQEDYIKDMELDFQKGSVRSGKAVWQIRSENNLMGYGATHSIPSNLASPPSATVHPYYLKYVREHFAKLTNKAWRIGYDA